MSASSFCIDSAKPLRSDDRRPFMFQLTILMHQIIHRSVWRRCCHESPERSSVGAVIRQQFMQRRCNGGVAVGVEVHGI